VDFIAFHKARITGLLAPESAGWKINMVPVVTSWNDSNQDIDISETGTTLSFVTPSVVSWGTGVDDENITLKD